MNRREIFEKVVDSADRFGPRNPQQSRFFGSLLNKCSHEEIFYGLLAVFIECPIDEKHFQRQELAGRLLGKFRPNYKFDLESTLRAVLPNYNASIEQLPRHFAHVHGTFAVILALEKVAREDLTERERICVRTMRWWLTGDADAPITSNSR
jgi:hypothetical protein